MGRGGGVRHSNYSAREDVIISWRSLIIYTKGAYGNAMFKAPVLYYYLPLSETYVGSVSS